jgi:ATP-dependent Clp protease ATP-binding subunit ClpX
MFELPGLDGVEEVVVNEEAVGGVAKPLLIYGEQKAKKKEAAGAAG